MTVNKLKFREVFDIENLGDSDLTIVLMSQEEAVKFIGEVLYIAKVQLHKTPKIKELCQKIAEKDYLLKIKSSLTV